MHATQTHGQDCRFTLAMGWDQLKQIGQCILAISGGAEMTCARGGGGGGSLWVYAKDW